MMSFSIPKIDATFAPKLQAKIDNLNKPKGSLGRLESLALQIGLIQHSLSPKISHPTHILFGADHGIEREGVSVSPREVTWQQMLNFANGGGGVNLFCRQHDFDLRLVDVGVDHDFHTPAILNRKIAYGTKNFLHEAAMSVEQMNQALSTGCEMANYAKNQGSTLISFGEMGIANTSASSLFMHLLTDIPLDKCIGRGAGLNDAGLRHKHEVLNSALNNFLISHAKNADAPEVIRWFGGFEMVAAIGGMLRAAELGMVILIDGFIMTACMLAAIKLYPEVKNYAIFCHCGDESGHKILLDCLDAAPLLNLGLRLGEGTGALCAFPLIDSAVRMINEMGNFQDAHITKYF